MSIHPHNSKTAIVTGAGSGIGRALALQLGTDGYHVVLVSRTESSLHETASAFADPAAVMVSVADWSKSDQIKTVLDRTLEYFGGIDLVANVAGMASLVPIEQVTADLWRGCVDSNLSAIVLSTAAVWPIFKKQGSGLIVNISSMASFDPFPGLDIYGAAKVAVNLFTRSTARHGAEIGVRAVCIAPGAVETPMLRGLFGLDQIPRAKTLTPEQVASTICDCITGHRDFESGETIQLPSPA